MRLYRANRFIFPIFLSHTNLFRVTAFVRFTQSIAPKGAYSSMIQNADWVDLRVAPGELRPQFTLTNGQCFNWKSLGGTDDELVWVGVAANR